MIIISIGCLVGLLMGLTGAGGGVIAVPLLMTFLHLPMTAAAPIALIAAAGTASLGAIVGLRAGIVRYKAAFLMALAGIICSPIGIMLARHINHRVLIVCFACLLLSIAFHTLRHNHRDPVSPSMLSVPCQQHDYSGKLVWTSRCTGMILLAGSVAGMLSGVLGVGGGFVIVPTLQKYSTLSYQAVVATSLTVTALIATSVVVISARSLSLHWWLVIPFAVSTLLGLMIGKAILAQISATLIQRVYATLLSLIAVMLFVSQYNRC